MSDSNSLPASLQPQQSFIPIAGEVRECKHCHRVQPIEVFSRVVVKGAEFRYRVCNTCRNLNRDKIPSAQEKLALISAAKEKPCTDCGRCFPPVCMDFDHARGRKLFLLSQWRAHCIEELEAEMANCDVVCSNCHRVRTQARGNESHVGSRPRGRPPHYLAEVPAAEQSPDMVAVPEPEHKEAA